MERKSLITRRAGVSTPEVEPQKALEKNRNPYMWYNPVSVGPRGLGR
jgi:hypothetical protein